MNSLFNFITISVIVSVYKSDSFMRECLTDLINQTVASRLEIIIIGATSPPEDEGGIVHEFQKHHPNILYIRTPQRISIYSAWNLVIRNASALFITPFSTNDRLSPKAYEQLFSALNDNPDVMLVYGDMYLTGTPHQAFERHDRIGAYRWPPYSYEFLVAMNCVGPHPMWRRAVHDIIGCFYERDLALADQEFWLWMGEQYKLLHIPVVTDLYWQSPSAVSQQRIANEEYRSIRRGYAQRYLENLNNRRDQA